MNSAMLEFPGARAKRSLAARHRSSEEFTAILYRLDELRYDLECIEKAIRVVERLALTKLSDQRSGAGKAALRRRTGSPAKNKNRSVALPASAALTVIPARRRLDD